LSDPQSSRFARHVHEVVALDEHGASYEAIEARVDSMRVDREERSALWSLASSLHNGVGTHQQTGGSGPLLASSHR
jgi:hypothetical protein